ncbi:MAG: imidazole glycerol phosphate synthase subunit HisH [Polyangiaceae bacterium]|nr:imidazole glycerol phosphate synthase subunit HisH [Polyangiaceae bacterium]
MTDNLPIHSPTQSQNNPHSVFIIRTGVANLASVLSAFRRLGTHPIVTDDPRVVESAEAVVLPGVGAFSAGMESLRARGLDKAVIHRVERGLPLLAVCLGLQLLLESSEEGPGVSGLGVIPGHAARFNPETGVRIPQLGWNRVSPGPSCALLREGYAYYANSYCLKESPTGFATATTYHGESFVGAVEKGPLLACQFHPELSGAWGLDLLGRWLRSAISTTDIQPTAGQVSC